MKQILISTIFIFFILGVQSSLLCSLCQSTVSVSEIIFKFLLPTSTFIEIMSIVCDRQFESETMCDEISKQITPLALQSVTKGFFFNKGGICRRFCENYQKYDIETQKNRILNTNRLDEINILNFTTQKITLNTNEKIVKVLHLSDIHLDDKYVVNSSTICSYIICCRKQNGFPEQQQFKAKHYGSKNCDLPQQLLQSCLKNIKDTQNDISLVFVTGDYSAHNQWQKTTQSIRKMPEYVDQKIKNVLGVEHIIRSMGNNEYLPDHQTNINLSVDEIIKVYKIYNQKEFLFTVINLNTILCDTINLNIILNQTLTIKQLKTLQKILEEQDNIYIVAHISPASRSCSLRYLTIFKALVTKYSRKIIGHFFGHNHQDQFMPFTSLKQKNKLVSFGFNVGSLSPFYFGNSRYRIYQLHPKGVVDYRDFINKNYESANWTLNYSFKQYYNIKDVQKDQPIPLSVFESLLNQILTKQDVLKQYLAKVQQDYPGKQTKCALLNNQAQKRQCLGPHITFKQKIVQIAEIFHGNWGYYL